MAVLDDILFDQAAAWAAIDQIDQIGQPVLLLWGDRDPLLECATLEQTRTRRPDWELYVFADAGHGAPIARPAEYAAAVSAWLESHRDARVGSQAR